MDDVCDKFRRVSRARYTPLSQLMIGEKYHVAHADRTFSSAGSNVIFYLSGECAGVDQYWIIYLPRNYAWVLSDADLYRINNGPKMYFLTYRGWSEREKQVILELTSL